MRNIGVVHPPEAADQIVETLSKEFPGATFVKGVPDSGAPGRVSIQMRTDTAEITEPVVESIGRRFQELKFQNRGQQPEEQEGVQPAPRLVPEGQRQQDDQPAIDQEN